MDWYSPNQEYRGRIAALSDMPTSCRALSCNPRVWLRSAFCWLIKLRWWHKDGARVLPHHSDGTTVCTVVLAHTTWQVCALQSRHLKAPQPKDQGFSCRAWTLALLDICVVFECIAMASKTQISLTPCYRQGTWILKTLRSHTMNDWGGPDAQVLGFQALCALIYHLLLGVGISINIYWVKRKCLIFWLL